MEDNMMERKFGELTLDEIKKTCEICLCSSKTCSDGCPMNKISNCRMSMNKIVLELIDVYKDTRKMHQYWFTKAQELQGKADKYDSVRNELIRTQELLKDAQDECRKRAESMKDMREEIDSMLDELANVHAIHDDLNCKLEKAEAARKSLEIENEDLKDKMEYRKNVIDQLMKEKDETNAELLHYHVLLGSLKAIGKAIFNDQSGNHEED
jgi:chromosome segregation ATPase